MSSPLISASSLIDHLHEVTVLDVRYRLGGPSGREEYAAGHIPGAVYVDLDTDLAAPPGGIHGRHPLPTPGRFEEAMARAGVSNDRPVVVYDDWSAQAAARCWWLLRDYGHRDVRVLDGGWAAWRAAGGEVATDVVRPALGDFTGGPGHLPTVSAATVTSMDVVVDARAPERYRGETEPLDPVAGHIPGAVNVPTARNLDNHGHLRDAHELVALYAEVGVVPGTDVAAYCGSGVTACLDVLAMEIAGIHAALYPGSWSEWVSDPDRAVERG